MRQGKHIFAGRARAKRRRVPEKPPDERQKLIFGRETGAVRRTLCWADFEDPNVSTNEVLSGDSFLIFSPCLRATVIQNTYFPFVSHVLY